MYGEGTDIKGKCINMKEIIVSSLKQIWDTETQLNSESVKMSHNDQYIAAP